MTCPGICDFVDAGVTELISEVAEARISLLESIVDADAGLTHELRPPMLFTQVFTLTYLQERAVAALHSEVQVTTSVWSGKDVTTNFGIEVRNETEALERVDSDVESVLSDIISEVQEVRFELVTEEVSSDCVATSSIVATVDTQDKLESTVQAEAAVEANRGPVFLSTPVYTVVETYEQFLQQIETLVTLATSITDANSMYVLSTEVTSESCIWDRQQYLELASVNVVAVTSIDTRTTGLDLVSTSVHTEESVQTIFDLWFTAHVRGLPMSVLERPQVRSGTTNGNRLFVIGRDGNIYTEGEEFATGSIEVDLRSVKSLARKRLEYAWIESDYPVMIQATTRHGAGTNTSRLDESAKIKFGKGIRDTRIQVRLEAEGLSVRRIDLGVRPSTRRY